MSLFSRLKKNPDPVKFFGKPVIRKIQTKKPDPLFKSRFKKGGMKLESSKQSFLQKAISLTKKGIETKRKVGEFILQERQAAFKQERAKSQLIKAKSALRRAKIKSRQSSIHRERSRKHFEQFF